MGNAVVGEIDELRGRLAAIDPNALSDAEKLALTAALAFLEAIDLQAQVIGGLKDGYHSAENEVRAIFNQIVAALNQLRDKVFVFNPETVLGPINAVLAGANALLDQLNARTLLAPLYAQIDSLQSLLQDLAPAACLPRCKRSLTNHWGCSTGSIRRSGSRRSMRSMPRLTA